MRLRPPEVPHEEDWQRVAADIDALLQELVDESGSAMPHRAFKLRLVKLKLESLKRRLRLLKQRWHQHLQQMDERLRVDRTDLEARYLAAAGTERLADLWLLEGLLDRLSGSANKRADLGGFSYELPSTRSSEVGESA